MTHLNDMYSYDDVPEYAQEDLMDMMDDGTIESIVMGDEHAECADGCIVEPDGVCPHGYKSPLLLLGII